MENFSFPENAYELKELKNDALKMSTCLEHLINYFKNFGAKTPRFISDIFTEILLKQKNATVVCHGDDKNGIKIYLSSLEKTIYSCNTKLYDHLGFRNSDFKKYIDTIKSYVTSENELTHDFDKSVIVKLIDLLKTAYNKLHDIINNIEDLLKIRHDPPRPEWATEDKDYEMYKKYYLKQDSKTDYGTAEEAERAEKRIYQFIYRLTDEIESTGKNIPNEYKISIKSNGRYCEIRPKRIYKKNK